VLQPERLRWLAVALTTVALLGTVIAAFGAAPSGMPNVARAFSAAWLAVSLLGAIAIARWSRIAAYLVGLFALLVGWRIAGLYGVGLVVYPGAAAFAAYVLWFFAMARASLAGGGDPALREMRGSDWHLAFFRLYVGFDFVPHFTEKLFAGPGPHMEDVEAFQQLGTVAPNALVWVAGLCELGAAIGIGLGVLCRLAAVGTALYLAIASVTGNHFALGFIWASPGGGWEYPLLWTVLTVSFVYAGAGRFSIDGELLRSLDLPGRVRGLMQRGGIG
jgi:putative oxidoreductase